LLQADRMAAVRDEKESVMKPVKASPTELRDLIAYLSNMDRLDTAGAPPPSPAPTAAVDFARIRNPEPGDWLTYNGSLTGNRYSPLEQVNTSNVARLAPKWIFPIDHFGLETTPVVADGVMYVTAPNQAIALDALNGRQLWKYSRP